MNFQEKKILQIAFVISIILHLFLIFSFTPFHFKKQPPWENNESQKLDITFSNIKLKKVKPQKQKGTPEGKKESKEKKSIKVNKKENKKIQPIDKKNEKKVKNSDKKEVSDSTEDKQQEEKRQPKKKQNKKEEVEKENKDKRKTTIVGAKQVSPKERPAFVQYYRFIRNKIKVVAQSNTPDRFKEGKVKVIFRLSSNGRIKDLKVDEDKSIRNRILRFSAIESIKEASPFPAFPKGLTATELEFRITIEFHI